MILKLLHYVIQKPLDVFYHARNFIGTMIAFLAIRFTAVEVTWAQMKEKKSKPHPSAVPAGITLPDPDTTLDAAKDVLEDARNRRDAVTDKAKTLITLSGLFIALLGFLLPKDLGIPEGSPRIVMYVAIALFTLSLVLLLSFFDIGSDASPNLATAASMQSADQKKELVSEYCNAAAAIEGRSDHLVDVYKAARFYFYAAFLMAIFVVASNYAAPSNQTEKVIQALRADPKLSEFLKGQPGATGPQGPSGAPGKLSELDKARIIKGLRIELEKERKNKTPLKPH